jgi:hypothetical protein
VKDCSEKELVKGADTALEGKGDKVLEGFRRRTWKELQD